MNLIKKFWLIIVLVVLLVVLLFIKNKYANKTEIKTKTNNQTNLNSEVVEIKTTVTQKKENQDNNGSENNNGNSSENIFTTNEGETINANDYKTEALSDEVSVDNLEPFLPYEGKYFTVKKYFKPGYLEVIVKNESDLNNANEEVEKWLKENNTDSEETQLIFIFEN